MHTDLLTRLRAVATDPERATDMGVSCVANAPLGAAELARAEALLGFALPSALRTLYTQVGDGNFGAGYGILPLLDGKYASTSSSAVKSYLAWRADAWLEGLLPFCYHGCTVYSVVHAQTGRVGIVDIGAFEPGMPEHEFMTWQKKSLTDWLEAWLAGENLFFALEDDV
jgi:hypothetical protein